MLPVRGQDRAFSQMEMEEDGERKAALRDYIISCFSYMPSRLRAADDHAALILATNHLLAIPGNTGAPIYVDANALPYPIDVLSAPDLALSLSGTCDRVKIPSKVVARSHIAKHLIQYLRTVISAV